MVYVMRIFGQDKDLEHWSGAGFIEASTTLRLRRRVGERHLPASRQNLPGGKAVPSQYKHMFHCFKKYIVDPSRFQSENYMSCVKKSQGLKKKSRIELAEDTQKRISNINCRF